MTNKTQINETRIPLKPGDAGVEDTIALMRSYVKEYYRNSEIAKIVNGLIGNNDYETAKNCLDYVSKTIRYELDPDWQELVKSVKHTLLGDMNYGDCDDLSVALSTLLEACGIESYFRTVAWKKGSSRNFSHVYCLAYFDDKQIYIPIDPTMSYSGFGKEVVWFRQKTWKVL